MRPAKGIEYALALYGLLKGGGEWEQLQEDAYFAHSGIICERLLWIPQVHMKRENLSGVLVYRPEKDFGAKLSIPDISNWTQSEPGVYRSDSSQTRQFLSEDTYTSGTYTPKNALIKAVLGTEGAGLIAELANNNGARFNIQGLDVSKLHCPIETDVFFTVDFDAKHSPEKPSLLSSINLEVEPSTSDGDTIREDGFALAVRRD